MARALARHSDAPRAHSAQWPLAQIHSQVLPRRCEVWQRSVALIAARLRLVLGARIPRRRRDCRPSAQVRRAAVSSARIRRRRDAPGSDRSTERSVSDRAGAQPSKSMRELLHCRKCSGHVATVNVAVAHTLDEHADHRSRVLHESAIDPLASCGSRIPRPASRSPLSRTPRPP